MDFTCITCLTTCSLLFILSVKQFLVHSGHYTGARRYEFFFSSGENNILRTSAASKILFFKPSSNFLFII